jgi:DNA-binding MarR family transcriptional regulator
MSEPAKYPWRKIPRDGHTLSTPEFLTAKINTLARALKRLSSKVYLDNFGVTVTEWRMLAAIVQQQPCAASELAFSLGSDRALTGRTLKKLENRKLVSIGIHPKDGRAVVIKTTAAGDAMYRTILPFAQARQADLLRQLSEAEREQFWIMLDRLTCYVTDLSEPGDDTEPE